MYQDGAVLGVGTVATGVAAVTLLPETSGISIFTYIAYAAIAIGTAAIVLQLAFNAYRALSLRK